MLFLFFFYSHFIFIHLVLQKCKKRLKPTIKIGSSYSNNNDWYWVFRSLKYYLLTLFSFKKIRSKKNGDEITKFIWDQYQVFSGHCLLFYTPWKHQKIFGFLFSGSIKLTTTDIFLYKAAVPFLISHFPVTFSCSKSTIRTLKWCEICSKLSTKKLERRQWRRSDVFIVNFEHISLFSFASIVDFQQANVSWGPFFGFFVGPFAEPKSTALRTWPVFM